MHLDPQWLQSVLPEAVIEQGSFTKNLFFSVDSRTLDENHLFFALSGAKVDGHEFVANALVKAAGVVIAASKREELASVLKDAGHEKVIIVVPDPLKALIALAAAWRSRFAYPVAAITGSLGKTTTKELTAHMLACAHKKYVVSEGNLNTVIGVALTISRMTDEYEGALFEVGISKPGEMAKIIAMLRPTTGLITCISYAHIEAFGSLAAIAQEKRMLFSHFTDQQIGIINGDQPVLAAIGYAHPVVKFGFKMTNHIQARRLKITEDHLSFTLCLYGRKYPLTLFNNHKGLVQNMIAATALAHQLGVSDGAILEGIKTIPVRKQRFEVRTLKAPKGMLIDDCYNASPESVKAALKAFDALKAEGKKVVVLGDMLELGEKSPFWHRQIGRFLRKTNSLHTLILVGSNVAWVEKTAPAFLAVTRVPSWQEAISELQAVLEEGSVVLVKGSRGMQLQHVVAAFADNI